MKKRIYIAFALVFTCSALVVACESVPSFTFEDGDAALEEASTPDVKTTDGGVDAKATDAGKTDANTVDANDAGSGGNDAAGCGGGAGDICCGTEICHGCAPSDCPQCVGLGCGSTEVCCLKGGSNMMCKLPAQGC